MLSLIGLGLYDEKGLTLRGIKEAKNSDKVYIELYTGKWNGDLENLSKIIGKKVIELTRKDLEENMQKILDEAKDKKISIFVQGDPLVATTHTILLQNARKFDIGTKVIHNSSIVSAIGETGLHIYKFGTIVTIPFLEKTNGIPPQSIYDNILKNKENGLHTLCLLDVTSGKNEYMDVNQALNLLIELEGKNKKNVINTETRIVVFNVNENSKIYYGTIKSLSKQVFELPASIIIPGKLHFTEKEYLELYEV